MHILKILVRIGTMLVAGAMLFATGAPASAATIEELMVQIAALQAQIAALQQATPAPSPTDEMPLHPGAVVGREPFRQTLQRGSQGSEVSRLQKLLGYLGTDIYPENLITGYFGSLTEAAVKRFQTRYGVEAVGIVGPKTRAKINGLLAPPCPQVAPIAPDFCPNGTITPNRDSQTQCVTGYRCEPIPAPAPAPTPAPTPAPAPTPPPPPPPPAYIPTQYQLGLPAISSFKWGSSSLNLIFTHDPASYTRSYMVYLKKPGDTSFGAYGPYTIPNISEITTAMDGTSLKRIAANVWEWKQPVNYADEADGGYTAYLAAAGDGGVESQATPLWSATLYPTIIFDPFYQGPNTNEVKNSVFSDFPLKFRITNFYIDLYYKYRLYDGDAVAWESAYTNSTASSKIEVNFRNLDNYPFASGKTYRLRAEAFDNDLGHDSQSKQKPAETTLKYLP